MLLIAKTPPYNAKKTMDARKRLYHGLFSKSVFENYARVHKKNMTIQPCSNDSKIYTII